MLLRLMRMKRECKMRMRSLAVRLLRIRRKKKTLRSLEPTNYDCVLVAIGDHIQESILTTLLLKELGVKKSLGKGTK